MDAKYHHRKVESTVQKRWQEAGCFLAREDDSRPTYYCLSMLPYPSGRLHMGHVRNYSIGDAVARYRQMRGYNVMQPMGWDAFGLPAENAAISNRAHPDAWTRANIGQMRDQLMQLGFAIDWRREFATCEPDYYRWEQLLFLRMWEKGLAYRASGPVNWDPVDQTVLANEQVIDGRGWRTGALIERREIPMWFFRITAYADDLLEELDDLEWPENVKTMQRAWIGRSTGMNLTFPHPDDAARSIKVYTTRPDTVMGTTFMAVAAEHPWAKQAAESDSRIAAFCAECQTIAASDEAIAKAEKRGMPLGMHARNPINGEAIPVWVANYVLMEYGEGAVMGVPGHDQRDFDFARANGLEIRRVIVRAGEAADAPLEEAFEEHGIAVNSGPLDGSDYDGCIAKLEQMLGPQGHAERTVKYRLRDWGVSRQRYWGCPIPIIYCSSCGEVPVPESDLPIVLPLDAKVDGVKSPLAEHPAFSSVPCPSCGGPARREADTFDTFVDSSWYFSRYASPDADTAMLDERAAHWMPVDQYIGGIEHAVMHLLYARFLHKVMRDLSFHPGDCGSEPFKRLLCQGMVIKDGHKMSKSRNNTVDPQAYVDSAGADATRMFMLFSAPPEQKLEWSDAGVRGCERYIVRLWKQAAACREAVRATAADAVSTNAHARREIHLILRKADFDMQRLRLNTIVSAGMTLANLLAEHSGDAALQREGFSILLRLMNPMVPHIAEQLWHELGFEGLLADAEWPQTDEAALDVDEMQMIVQLNGRKCGQIQIAVDAPEEEIVKAATKLDLVKQRLKGASVRKAVVVPGRVINLVA